MDLWGKVGEGKGEGLGDVVQWEKIEGNRLKGMGEMKTTFAAMFNDIAVFAKVENKQEFIEHAAPVLERFELEAFEEDVFPYDETEDGGWGDEDCSLEQYLSERGIALSGSEVVVIIEDEIEGVQVQVENGKTGSMARK